jgi:hypothetical protein
VPKFPFGDIGPGLVTLGYGESDALSFGPTLSQTSIKIKDEKVNVEEERYGSTAVDMVISGTSCEIELPVTRLSAANLLAALKGDPVGSDIGIFAHAGCASKERSRPMLIQPLCDGIPNPDPASWVYFYYTDFVRNIDLGFDRKGQRVLLLVFTAFPAGDDKPATPLLLGKVGFVSGP